jgi:hypothetical protein
MVGGAQGRGQVTRRGELSAGDAAGGGGRPERRTGRVRIVGRGGPERRTGPVRGPGRGGPERRTQLSSPARARGGTRPRTPSPRWSIRSRGACRPADAGRTAPAHRATRRGRGPAPSARPGCRRVRTRSRWPRSSRASITVSTQAADGAYDRHRPVAHRVQLAQATWLEPRRHQEQVGAGVDAAGQRRLEADADGQVLAERPRPGTGSGPRGPARQRRARPACMPSPCSERAPHRRRGRGPSARSCAPPPPPARCDRRAVTPSSAPGRARQRALALGPLDA